MKVTSIYASGNQIAEERGKGTVRCNQAVTVTYRLFSGLRHGSQDTEPSTVRSEVSLNKARNVEDSQDANRLSTIIRSTRVLKCTDNGRAERNSKVAVEGSGNIQNL